MLAFEPRQSDLPLQVAFPILLANLTGELLGGSAAPTEAVAPGTPVTLTIPSGATGLTVTRPDGIDDRARPARDRRRDADVRPRPTCSASTRSRRSSDPSASAASERVGSTVDAARQRQSAADRGPVRADPVRGRPVRRRRVDDRPGVRRADRGPRDGARGVAPARSGSDPGVPATTRDELWVPILLIVLVALCVEWARLPPRCGHPHPPKPGGALRARAGRREHLMGVSLDAPLALLLLDPGARADGGPARRGPSADGRADAGGSPWRSARCCWPRSSSPSPDSSSSCRSIGSRRCSSSTCRTRSGTSARTMRSRSSKPRSRRSARATWRASWRSARTRWSSACRRDVSTDVDRPHRIDAGPDRDGHRGRPPSRVGAVPRRRPEADRAAVGRQRHDRRRPDRGGPRRRTRDPDRDAPDRARLDRRGPGRAADEPVDRAPGRVGPGRRRDPVVGRPDGDGPALRRRHARRRPSRSS